MNNFGLIVVKPDAVGDGLTDSIINEIESYRGKLILKKTFQFLPKHIPRILLPIDFLQQRPLMAYGYIQNYLGSESVIAIFKFPEEVDAQSLIVEIKGKIDTGGIRKKLFPYNSYEMSTVETLESPGASTDIKLGLMKARNRLHSPDNVSEFEELIELVLTEEERKYLCSIGYLAKVNGELYRSKLR